MSNYHPNPDINTEVHHEAFESEAFDVSVGYPPRPWQCDCGAVHSRGHFGNLGVHRCMRCGYTGSGGMLLEPTK